MLGGNACLKVVSTLRPRLQAASRDPYFSSKYLLKSERSMAPIFKHSSTQCKGPPQLFQRLWQLLPRTSLTHPQATMCGTDFALAAAVASCSSNWRSDFSK